MPGNVFTIASQCARSGKANDEHFCNDCRFLRDTTGRGFHPEDVPMASAIGSIVLPVYPIYYGGALAIELSNGLRGSAGLSYHPGESSFEDCTGWLWQFGGEDYSDEMIMEAGSCEADTEIESLWDCVYADDGLGNMNFQIRGRKAFTIQPYIHFSCRIRYPEIPGMYFIGLYELNSGGEYLRFMPGTLGGTVACETSDGGGNVLTTDNIPCVVDTFHTYTIKYENSQAFFYIDGAQVAVHSGLSISESVLYASYFYAFANLPIIANALLDFVHITKDEFNTPESQCLRCGTGLDEAWGDCLWERTLYAGVLGFKNITFAGNPTAAYRFQPNENCFEDCTFYDPQGNFFPGGYVGPITAEIIVDTYGSITVPEYSVWSIMDDATHLYWYSNKLFGIESGYSDYIIARKRSKLTACPPVSQICGFQASGGNSFTFDLATAGPGFVKCHTADGLGWEDTDNIPCDITVWHIFEIRIKDGHAYYYIDDVEVAHHTTHIDLTYPFQWSETYDGGGLGYEEWLDYLYIILGVPF